MRYLSVILLSAFCGWNASAADSGSQEVRDLRAENARLRAQLAESTALNEQAAQTLRRAGEALQYCVSELPRLRKELEASKKLVCA